MNFGEIQTHTKDILNFNPAQANADFTVDQLKRAINFCLSAEVDRVKLHAHPAYFLASQDFTWTSGAETQALPTGMQGYDFIRFYDVTDDSTGPGNALALPWENRTTLRWGTSGPSSARTIRAVYYARPATLVSDADVPDLLPPEFHEIICWSAASYLRMMADEDAPGRWLVYLEERRLDMIKRMSRRPAGTPSRVVQEVIDSLTVTI